MPQTEPVTEPSTEVSLADMKTLHLKHRSITVKISHEMFEELKYHASTFGQSLAQLTHTQLEDFLAKKKEKIAEKEAEKEAKKPGKAKKKG